MEPRTLKELVDGLEAAGITEYYRLLILEAASREREQLIDEILEKFTESLWEAKN